MVYINAISFHLPKDTLDNKAIIKEYKAFGGSDDSITEESIHRQCGVRQRHISAIDETPKDLGNKAVQLLFEEWCIDKKQVEFLIFVSGASDYKGPATSRLMQSDLELNINIGTIDILDGCTV